MKRNPLLILVLLVVTCFFLNAPARAADEAEQKAAKPGGAKPAVAKNIGLADLSDVDSSPSEVRPPIERYVVDRSTLSRSYAIESERGGFGGFSRSSGGSSSLTDVSPARRNRMKQFYTEWLKRLDSLEFETMSQDGRIDYLLFKNHLNHELRDVDIQAKAAAEAAPLVPFAQTIIDLEEARRRMQPVDAAKAAAILDNLNADIEKARKTVEAGMRAEGKGEGSGAANKVKKTVANRAATAVNGLRNALRNWYGFYNGYDPVFTWWVGEPYKAVDKTLQGYASFLRERIAGVRADDQEAIIGNPIGREALLSELAYEMIPYTPEELVALANQEYAWCETEMKRAARDLGYGDDWHKALEHVKTLHVEPGRQPQLIRDLAVEAIEFMDKHDLVTVPQLARDTWRMEMMSPERQLVNPFFTGGEVISVSFPTNSMSHEQKMMSMRGNNIHFSRATVFHELIPGHHLQGFMASRYRIYRTPFSTAFLTEGWSLYWEMLLWDMNFAGSPENRIGMLFWRMHRCARIIFSLSFHLEKMTPQECIDFLVERVGHERDNATAEVRRSFNGSYGPLYQAAYMLGGLQIRAMHRELVESGRMTNRAFHDAILKENRIPVEMIRASLTKQKLTRDFVSNWKFYGPNPGKTAD